MKLNSGKKLHFFIYSALLCIAWQQLYIINSVRLSLSVISDLSFGQSDFISIYEKKLTNAKLLMPPKSTIGYVQDSGISVLQGHIFLSQYAIAPRLLKNSLLADTILANFPISGTIQCSNNPLYAERNNWFLLKDFKNGFLLLKRKQCLDLY